MLQKIPLAAFAFALSFTVATAAVDPYATSCASDPKNCCFPQGAWPAKDGKTFRCEKVGDSYPCAIRFKANSWTGSLLNIHLAAIFIEEYLGYPVEILTSVSETGIFQDSVQENDSDQETGMWTQLVQGIFDVMLEIWPSGHRENYFKYTIQDGSILDAGALGAVGKIGWYTPRYVIDEINPSLEYWRTLKNLENILTFKNPSPTSPCCPEDIYATNVDLPCMAPAPLGGTSVEHGGYESSVSCTSGQLLDIPTFGGRFLAGASDWTQIDSQIIENLGLNLTIEYAGSEVGLVEAAAKSIKTREPLLMYFWKPHALFYLYNMSSIMLPAHTEECWAKEPEGKVDCDYPIEYLYKVIRKDFAEDKPDAAVFVSAFQYSSTTQQEEMLANMFTSTDSFKETACKWAKSNPETYQKWIDAVDSQFSEKIWKQETLEPSFIACPCTNEGTRLVFKLQSSSEHTEVVSWEVPEDLCSMDNPASATTVYKTHWTSKEYPIEKVNIEFSCPYVPSNGAHSPIIIGIVSIAAVVHIFIALGIFLLRTTSAIKAARLNTMIIFLFGSLLINAASILSIGEGSELKCVLRPLLMIFGFVYFSGSLFVKQYIITSLMRLKYKLDKNNARKKTFLLRFQFPVLSLIASLLSALWVVVLYVGYGGPLSDVEVDAFYGVVNRQCEANTVLMMLYIFFGFILLVVSCIYAQQTKDFSGVIFGEAKFMFFSNYNAAIFFTFAIALSALEGIGAPTLSVMVSICVFMATTVTATLIGGSRIYAGMMNMSEIISTKDSGSNSKIKPMSTMVSRPPSLTGQSGPDN